MNHQGKGSGLALIAILIVALIVAFLAVQQFASLKAVQSPADPNQMSPVEQAQQVVGQINDASQRTLDALKDF